MTTNAPVGPPICTRDPPSAEMRNPATMAVHKPRPGVTPLAIANAMAKGRATMPTMTPAVTSARSWRRSYPRSVVTSFGTSMSSGAGGRSVYRVRSGSLTRGRWRRGREQRFCGAKKAVYVEIGLDDRLDRAALDEADGDCGEIGRLNPGKPLRVIGNDLG